MQVPHSQKYLCEFNGFVNESPRSGSSGSVEGPRMQVSHVLFQCYYYVGSQFLSLYYVADQN